MGCRVAGPWKPGGIAGANSAGGKGRGDDCRCGVGCGSDGGCGAVPGGVGFGG